MAISATTVFEVRGSGAGVSDNNGGGFVPGSSGTDFSQQNSPQYALTGLASAGAGNTILSAAAAADMVGNLGQAISGTNVNPGFYQVTAVSVGVSITFSTNNTGGSIATGVAASLVLNIGGALLTIGKATGAAVANNTVYCVGTFTTTAEIANALISGAGGFYYIGYSATRGDNGQATVTTSTNSVDVFNVGQAVNITFQNLTITVTAGTPGSGINARNGADATKIRCVNCVFSGGDRCIRGNRSGSGFGIDGLSVERCEVKNAVNHGINNTYITWFIGSFIHDNGGSGFLMDTNSTVGAYGFHSIFYKNGVSGVSLADTNVAPRTQHFGFWNCNFSTNTGAGVLSPNGEPFITAINCIADRNTTYGFDFGTASGPSFLVQYNNAFFNNTIAARRGNVDNFPAIGDITLSADPYTAVGTNFALNSNAGGGLACTGTGFPGTIPGGTGTANVGAFDPASGGSTTIFAVECNTSIVLNRGGFAGY